jgi:putative transposase
MKTKKSDGVMMIPSVWAGACEERKRGLRILPKSGDYFVHVTSRSAGQAFLFQDGEKAAFLDLLRRWAEFSGLTVLTHCLMDNHFHLLLFVPRTGEVDHAEILRRLAFVWSDVKIAAWQGYYENEGPEVKASMDAALRERMGDLPEFMRVLKRAFSCWYNLQNDRKGTLWDARYRSVVVEGNPLALMSVAAYIDLNPIRAGICEDPMQYRWSGYGEACGGDKTARAGLKELIGLSRGYWPTSAEQHRLRALREEKRSPEEVGSILAEEQQRRAEPKSWSDVQGAYRVWLYAKGASQEDNRYEKRKYRERKGFDPSEVVAEFERRGEVPLTEGLLKRGSFFTRGVGLGGDDFLQGLMEDFRSCFGAKRKKAGKKIQGGWEGLKTLRQTK